VSRLDEMARLLEKIETLKPR